MRDRKKLVTTDHPDGCDSQQVSARTAGSFTLKKRGLRGRRFVSALECSLHSLRLQSTAAPLRARPNKDQVTVSAIFAEGGYQEFTLRGGEWAVMLLSLIHI